MDRNHGTLAAKTGDQAGGDRAAFIQNHIKMDTVFCKVLRCQHHAVSADLLIVGRTQVEIDTREGVTLLQKALTSLQDGK